MVSEQTFYLLNEDELMKINDLCECLGLAVDKIIRGRRLIREADPFHPAVSGYDKMIHEVMIEEDADDDDEILTTNF